MDNVNVDDVAAYVESLKMYLKEDGIKNSTVKQIVIDMPSERYVKKNMSEEEANVLYESVRWAWKEITGEDIKETMKTDDAPETLLGNYWMLKNGLILHGVNHYVIIKRNISLFSALLNINAFLIHEKLASQPNDLIKLVIDNGGARAFITKDRRAYFQMNETTYAEWGRQKVKGLDFKSKIVKLIDSRSQFNGWSSGISIKL